jgi:peptide/nickel transport system ATP-binding protein
MGCRFRPRCAWAVERCAVEEPPLVTLGPDHRAACWVAEERNGHA